MKIQRNVPCPCGSGKKFKKCCINKSYENRLAEAIYKSQSNLKRAANIKHCLHPNKEECNGKIVKAHAIQNNRILSKLALDGCVITMDGHSNLIFQDAQKKGRKIATTFTGFCSYHDKTVFQDIEDKVFCSSTKQIFLLTYRTFAWHYHKKAEQYNRESIFTEHIKNSSFDATTNDEYKALFYGLNSALKDNDSKKALLDIYLLNSQYDKLSYILWEIPYEISFSVSMMHELEYDITGNQINDLTKDIPSKSIYLNIFPSDGKSYCIWSWLTKEDIFFSNFSKQFMRLDIKSRENYFNNNLPIWSDSIVISPVLWNIWGDDIQQSLLAHSNHTLLYEILTKENPELKKFTYMDTPWNFFEKI